MHFKEIPSFEDEGVVTKEQQKVNKEALQEKLKWLKEKYTVSKKPISNKDESRSSPSHPPVPKTPPSKPHHEAKESEYGLDEDNKITLTEHL
jgi:L-fucose isomerase-like protein